MKATNKQMVKQTLKIILGVTVVIALAVVGYRYYTRPVQTWNADSFEGRNPDKVEAKSQGQKYWTGSTVGDGFYITDEAMSSMDTKTYCVSGGVSSDKAGVDFGGVTIEAANGYFTRCAKLSVNDKHQLNIRVNSGTVQIYRVDRKR